MKIIISHSSMIPIYEQLIRQIRTAVSTEELKAGMMLPSVRTLAAELQISALTVKKAYDILESEGILISVQGKGSFVSETNTSLIGEKRRRDAEESLTMAIEKARLAGYKNEEIRQFIELILEDEK